MHKVLTHGAFLVSPPGSYGRRSQGGLVGLVIALAAGLDGWLERRSEVGASERRQSCLNSYPVGGSPRTKVPHAAGASAGCGAADAADWAEISIGQARLSELRTLPGPASVAPWDLDRGASLAAAVEPTAVRFGAWHGLEVGSSVTLRYRELSLPGLTGQSSPRPASCPPHGCAGQAGA
jgi:hypothetical protein